MKNVIITGSNSGIGYGCALDLARKGYKVFAGMRSLEKGAPLKLEAEKENLTLELLQLDVNSNQSMSDAVKHVLETDGHVDVLVNNAGISGGAPLEYVAEEDLRGIMETNFFGAFKMMQLVVPGMRERESGAIVNITSIAGVFANPVQSAYCASKFALEAASHALAGEVAQFNLRVVCVQPGVVLTPIFEKSPAVDEALLSPPFPYHRQLRRIGKMFEDGLKNPAYPQDVADAVYHAITADDFKQEYLVGKDAEALGGMIANESNQSATKISALETDEAYFAELGKRGYPIG